MPEQTAADRYLELSFRREYFLRRAREFAALTVPTLMPPEGFNASMDLPQPYLGLGGRAVLHLASKLMVALLPPGGKTFRLGATPEALMEQGVESVDPEVERRLAIMENTVHREIERRMWRAKLGLVIQHLEVTGNALVYLLPDNRLRVFRLDQFVVLRAPDGTPLEIIIREGVQPGAIPELGLKSKETKTLFTHLLRQSDGSFTVYQEVDGKTLASTRGIYAPGRCPFIPLRWSEVLGEDYGRSKVEDHEPDIRYADVLTKSVGDGAIMASRNVILQRPNAAGGLSLRRRLASARNGDVLSGNPEDITFLQFTNGAGIQFAAAELANVKRELAEGFLLNSAVRRDAERVTAYELRQMIDELDGVLGGVYSELSAELMQPLVSRLMVQMQANGQLPDFPEGIVEPIILTGIESLAREADVQKGSMALQMFQQLPPDQLDWIKTEDILKRVLTGLGFADATRTPDEVAAIQQQRAAMQAMTAAAPGMAQTVTEAAVAPQAPAA